MCVDVSNNSISIKQKYIKQNEFGLGWSPNTPRFKIECCTMNDRGDKIAFKQKPKCIAQCMGPTLQIHHRDGSHSFGN